MDGERNPDRRLGHEVAFGLAEGFVRDMDLLVRRGIHEVIVVAVVVQILHLPLVERGAFDVFFGPELVIHERRGSNVSHARLDMRPFVPGREMVQLEGSEKVIADFNQHALPQPRRLYR